VKRINHRGVWLQTVEKGSHGKAQLAEMNVPNETVEEGVITLESLVRAFSNVLGREEVERICKEVCDNYTEGEFRRAKLNEKLLEAAIEKSIHSQDIEWDEDIRDDGGLEFKRSSFDVMYLGIFSSEVLDLIWEECKDMDRDIAEDEESKMDPSWDPTRA